MSTTMQEALGLPVLEDLLLADKTEANESNEVVEVEEQPTSSVSSIEAKDRENQSGFERDTDEIFREAMKHASDLMALGYNVDTRSASKIFDTAATMMKLALDASSTKRSAQLNKAKLLLDERKVNYTVTGRSDKPLEEGEVETVEAKTVVNRNDLIKQLRQDSAANK